MRNKSWINTKKRVLVLLPVICHCCEYVKLGMESWGGGVSFE